MLLKQIQKSKKDSENRKALPCLQIEGKMENLSLFSCFKDS